MYEDAFNYSTGGGVWCEDRGAEAKGKLITLTRPGPRANDVVTARRTGEGSVGRDEHTNRRGVDGVYTRGKRGAKFSLHRALHNPITPRVGVQISENRRNGIFFLKKEPNNRYVKKY